MDGVLASMAAQMAGQQPQVQIASPLNDVQLVALIASQSGDEAPKAVDWAIQIVAEAVVQSKKLSELIQLKKTLANGRLASV